MATLLVLVLFALLVYGSTQKDTERFIAFGLAGIAAVALFAALIS